ncbi:MAG: tyrosine-type recombinase/integrase [Lachnospiraceae bacterium]|nr:tyrosine-type recombinase/integrase [Lachnospiraceae bacterium]
MTLQHLYEEFSAEKELQGLSVESIKDYKYHILRFLRYVGFYMDYRYLTKDIVDSYILSLLHDSKISRNTAATYVRNAKIFLCWIYDNYDLSFNPYKIKYLKTPKKNVHIYNAAEIKMIFDSMHNSCLWLEARNKAMVAIMLDSGVRQSEVRTLLKLNIDFDCHILKVTGKGAKDRFVSVGNYSMQLLNEYFTLCPFGNAEYVFVDRYGNQLTRNAVQLFINRLKHRTGIDITAHKLRHNYATNFCIDNLQLYGNTNVYDLSILMGHESIETTKKYEHFAHELVAVNNNISHLDIVFESINEKPKSVYL